MKVLITGACGFLGRQLIKELEPSHELVLVDRLPPNKATVFVPGSSERASAAFETKWPFIQSEIMDAGTIRKAVEGVDAVVHLAASVTGLPEHGQEIMTLNVIGTYIILDACRLAGVKRFCCASSINAFGTIYWRLSGKPVVYTKLPLSEDAKPVVEDPYSLSKLVNEETCATFTRAYGMTTAAFRFAGVWTEDGYASAKSKPLAPTTAWSDDLFQWVHPKDIVYGIRLAVEKRDLQPHGVYTLGAADTRCPEPTMDVIERTRPEYLKLLDRPLKGREPLLSIENARRAFGYEPRYRLGE